MNRAITWALLALIACWAIGATLGWALVITVLATIAGV